MYQVGQSKKQMEKRDTSYQDEQGTKKLSKILNEVCSGNKKYLLLKLVQNRPPKVWVLPRLSLQWQVNSHLSIHIMNSKILHTCETLRICKDGFLVN